MKYRFKTIILSVVVLCLCMTAVSMARVFGYQERYVNEVMQDEPNLYLKFDHIFPLDYSAAYRAYPNVKADASKARPYPIIGYIKDSFTEGEPNDLTKIVYAGGMGKSMLLDNSLFIGTGPHQGSGFYAYAERRLNRGSEYAGFNNIYSFDPVAPLAGNDGGDLTFEFWYKTLPPSEPQPEPISYFFNHTHKAARQPTGPAVAVVNGQFRIDCSAKFWYTGVDAPYDEKWHHVVVAYDEKWDENLNSMKVQLYLDGEFKGETVVTSTGVEIATNRGFESGLTGWFAYGSGSIEQRSSDPSPQSGSYYARVYNRTDANDGIAQSFLGKMEEGFTYWINCYARLGTQSSEDELRIFMVQTDDLGTRTIDLLGGTAAVTQTIYPILWDQVPTANPDIETATQGVKFSLNVTGTLTQLDLVIAGPQPGVDLLVDMPAGGGLRMVGAARGRMGPESQSLLIGGFGDRGYPFNCFAGYIDEFAIYNGVLSSERIQAHYDAWKPQSCEELWARGNPDGDWDSDSDGTPAGTSGPVHWDIIQGQYVGMLADLNQDCYIDLVDFALLAEDWAKCNTPGDSNCEVTW